MAALTADDIDFLRSLPASTEPPIGGTREQRRRADDLPWGLLREGRRTDLGDFVVVQADTIARVERERDVALADVARLTPPRLPYDLSVATPRAEPVPSRGNGYPACKHCGHIILSVDGACPACRRHPFLA